MENLASDEFLDLSFTMELGVSGICHQFKVGKMVVSDIAVFVVDNFSGIFKFSSKMLFHYPPVFWNQSAIFVENSISFFIKRTRTAFSYFQTNWRTSRPQSCPMFFTKIMTLVLTITSINSTRRSSDLFAISKISDRWVAMPFKASVMHITKFAKSCWLATSFKGAIHNMKLPLICSEVNT